MHRKKGLFADARNLQECGSTSGTITAATRTEWIDTNCCLNKGKATIFLPMAPSLFSERCHVPEIDAPTVVLNALVKGD